MLTVASRSRWERSSGRDGNGIERETVGSVGLSCFIMARERGEIVKQFALGEREWNRSIWVGEFETISFMISGIDRVVKLKWMEEMENRKTGRLLKWLSIELGSNASLFIPPKRRAWSCPVSRGDSGRTKQGFQKIGIMNTSISYFDDMMTRGPFVRPSLNSNLMSVSHNVRQDQASDIWKGKANDKWHKQVNQEINYFVWIAQSKSTRKDSFHPGRQQFLFFIGLFTRLAQWLR